MASKKPVALPPAIRCALAPSGALVATANRNELSVLSVRDGKERHHAKVKDVARLWFLDDSRLLSITTRSELALHDLERATVVFSQTVSDREVFGRMLPRANDVLVASQETLLTVSLVDGKVLHRRPLGASIDGLLLGADGGVIVSHHTKGGHAEFSALDEDALRPLFGFDDRAWLHVGAQAPGRRFVHVHRGLDRVVVDLEAHTALDVHKGLAPSAAFLDDRTLLLACKGELALHEGPSWKRHGVVAFDAECVAASADGSVIAAVGSKKGHVWMRAELEALASK